VADIIHRVGIKAAPTQVYQSLSTLEGLAGWWTREVDGDAAVGGRVGFTFRTPSGEVKGRMVMQVEHAAAPSALAWRCVDGPEEWVGTTIDYRLVAEDGQTTLLFGHRGWREPVDFMAHCSMKWATFLLSLRAAVETGIGRPSPDDLKIDNWN